MPKNQFIGNQKNVAVMPLMKYLEDLRSAEDQWDECLIEIDNQLALGETATLTREIEKIDPGEITLIDAERSVDIALKDVLCPKFYRHTLFVLMRY